MPRGRHLALRVSGSDRDESFWCHHHDQSCAPIFQGAACRAHHPGNIDRRTNWADRARTLRSGKVRRRGLLGITVQEVGPLGIKVTIVEPGGFRTDFAGISTDLREGRPEYDATVGATVRFQRDYDGKQPGDPAKAAAMLLHIASLNDPPLRLLLGSDSYNAAEQAALQRLELDRKWKDLSDSTDYASGDLSAR
jgi:hypothetical protein